MANAYLMSELVVKLPTRVGLLADVSAAVRDAGVSIEAISAYERDGVGKFLLVTKDNDKARAALTSLSAEVSEKSVLAVQMPDEPGALAAAAKLIADAGINVEYVFGTAAQEATGPESTLIFKTSDDERALGLF